MPESISTTSRCPSISSMPGSINMCFYGLLNIICDYIKINTLNVTEGADRAKKVNFEKTELLMPFRMLTVSWYL